MAKKTDPRAAGVLDAQIGKRIRTRRLELVMSQEQLGASIGVTFQQIQKYERGSNRVSASTLYRIADVLGVQVSALLPKKSGGVAEIAIDAPGAEDLAVVFASLNDTGRKALLSTARSFATDTQYRKQARRQS